MKTLMLAFAAAMLVAALTPAFGQEEIQFSPEPEGGPIVYKEGPQGPRGDTGATGQPGGRGPRGRRGPGPSAAQIDAALERSPIKGDVKTLKENPLNGTQAGHQAAEDAFIGDGFLTKGAADGLYAPLSTPAGASAVPEEGSMSAGMIVALVVFFGLLALCVVGAVVAAIAAANGGTRGAATAGGCHGLVPGGRLPSTPLDEDEAIKLGCDTVSYDTPTVSYRKVVHHDPPTASRPSSAIPAPTVAAVPVASGSGRTGDVTVNNAFTIVIPPPAKRAKAAASPPPAPAKPATTPTPAPPAPKTPTPTPKPATPAKPAATPAKPAAPAAPPAGKAAGRKRP